MLVQSFSTEINCNVKDTWNHLKELKEWHPKVKSLFIEKSHPKDQLKIYYQDGKVKQFTINNIIENYLLECSKKYFLVQNRYIITVSLREDKTLLKGKIYSEGLFKKFCLNKTKQQASQLYNSIISFKKYIEKS